MKKVMLILAAVLFMPTPSDAQFFKNLLKTAKEIGKQVLESSVDGSSTTGKALSNALATKSYATTIGAKVKTTMPNVRIDIKNAYHNGEGVIVEMTLTNTGNDTESFVFTGVKSQNFTTTPAYDGGKYSSNWKLGEHDWYHFGQEFNGSCWDYKIESGSQINALCELKGVSDAVTVINTVTFVARLGGTTYLVGEDERLYDIYIENIPVKKQATNSSDYK